jgi:hypothetical protein
MDNEIKLDKSTRFNITLELLAVIIAGVVSTMGIYYKLSSDIEEAKQLPVPSVSKTEWELKDQLIREAILNTQKQVEEMNKRLDRIENKLIK